MKTNHLYRFFAGLAMVGIMVGGCKHPDMIDDDINPNTVNPTTAPSSTPVDDLAMVNAGLFGSVTDENNSAIVGASVTSGTETTTTDASGTFVFNNLSLSKRNGNVTVTKFGYFNAVRSFMTTEGKTHSVRIQMMQKSAYTTLTGTGGGTVIGNGGATIFFPADAFVTAAGAPYAGTVYVYSRWIDPTASNLPFIIPGDLRGIGTNGSENLLQTYGMLGADIRDANNQVLKLAPGKNATLTFPVAPGQAGTAPGSIALWHFDEAAARWKEDGTAARSGGIYTATVNRFSFWNLDVPGAFITLDLTLINSATNSPLVSANVRLKRLTNGNSSYGYTNNTGFITGAVPINVPLVLEVVSACGAVVFSQNIGQFSANASLGNVAVSLPASQYINFSGTLLNCTGAPVTNGFISFNGGNGYSAFASTGTNGNFAFTILNCTGAAINYGYVGADVSGNAESSLLTGTATNGNISLGNITACMSSNATTYVAGIRKTSAGINVAMLWKNSVATNLTDGTREAQAYSVFVSGADVYVAGSEKNSSGAAIAKYWKNGVPVTLSSSGTSGAARSIFISGSDVYVAGDENGYPFYWKNGVGTNLGSTPGMPSGSASGVFVSGTDIYISGSQYGSGYVWKNGVDFAFGGTGSASSVYVANGDVYVSGYDYPRARFWKSSGGTYNATDLTTNGGSANSIVVSGGNTYTGGSFGNAAVVWKNGSTNNPYYFSDGLHTSFGNGIYVSGNDIYLVGKDVLQASASSIAKIWKNGFPINLTDGSTEAEAKAIFVQ